MKERIISGVVLAALIVGAGLAGGYVLAAAMLITSLIGFYELMRACGVLEKDETVNAITGLVGIMIVVYYAGLMVLAHRHAHEPEILMHSGDFFTVVMVVTTFLTTIALYVLTYPRYHARQLMYSLFGFLYVPFLLSFVYRARLLPFGLYVYALIFVCSSICDTCALAAGMLFGKHKMAPVLSPKKTMEGAVGGILGAAATAFLLALIVGRLERHVDLRLEFTVLGACGALLGIIGDLAASAIKRENDIKDYGNLIPGHGGIMDRFDSIIFTAPVVYLLGVLLLGLAT